MTRPALSVLIDTYNHERYIEQAIVSAVEQDFPASEYEILVVDDGSTDRTPQIVRKFSPRVRLLQKRNGGQASAFNVGIPEARGQFIAFLDGDDWFAPGKLDAVAKALEQHPEAAAVSHGYYDFYEKSNEVKIHVPPAPIFIRLSTVEAARQALHDWQFLVIGALTVRKKVLRRITPIPEVLKFLADAPIALAAMATGVFVFPNALCYYRHHIENLFAVDPNQATKHRQREEMAEKMYECLEKELLSLGILPEVVEAFVYPRWIQLSRGNLQDSTHGRLRALRTEMRAFRFGHAHPSVRYWLFKYAIVGAATILMSPRKFYKAREWYGNHNLGRVREQFAKAK